LDRVDKVLLILPLLPAADLLSTLFSLGSGGEEVGVLARPTLMRFGPVGLVILAVSASMIFLVSMRLVIHIKSLFVSKWKFKWALYLLAVPIYWFFLLEGFYVSTVVMNVLVAVSPVLAQIFALRAVLVAMYFSCAAAVTMSQIRRMPHL
jgi:hypothetical protein